MYIHVPQHTGTQVCTHAHITYTDTYACTHMCTHHIHMYTHHTQVQMHAHNTCTHTTHTGAYACIYAKPKIILRHTISILYLITVTIN